MRLVPGEEFGRYRVEAEIGRGGQAVVYRATQLDLDRPVALKVFDEGYLGRNGALARFRREAIAAGRLEHPRLVPVYDAGEVGGRAFMSMRLVAGDSLAERIARSGPLAPAEALAMLDDVADALDFAHARGAVHRDVKPANILLDPDGAAYLSDFGLVRMDDMPGLTRRGDWLGTAEYVSPEQVEGEPATARSDLYGLAAVAFEALTGRAPFVRREPSAVLLAQVRDPVPDASALAPSLPVAVDGVLARGLAKDPADRPPTGRALVDDLRLALGSPELRPTAIGGTLPLVAAGAAAGAAAGDPWDAALERFGEGEEGPGGDRPTQAFGDAARRRALSMKRDVLIWGSVVGAALLIGVGVLGWVLGSGSADTAGAEARGFDAGKAAGRSTGFQAGKTEGLRVGRAAGFTAGKKAGTAEGRKAGRTAGLAEGKAQGYASGVSAGRSAALGGVSTGGWYIVQVGSDSVGPVVSQASAISTDGSQCYAVLGSRVPQRTLLAVLLANAAATLAMVGLIWFVQVVHYPLLARLDAEGNAEHQRRTGWVVAPPMIVEAVTALALVAARPAGVGLGQAVAGAVLVAVLWISTAVIQVPRHRDLALGSGDAARLVRENWIRTAAWTARGALVIWMLAGAAGA